MTALEDRINRNWRIYYFFLEKQSMLQTAEEFKMAPGTVRNIIAAIRKEDNILFARNINKLDT